jgi:hypothetical protein
MPVLAGAIERENAAAPSFSPGRLPQGGRRFYWGGRPVFLFPASTSDKKGRPDWGGLSGGGHCGDIFHIALCLARSARFVGQDRLG